MEAGSLVMLLPELETFLGRFDDCFIRSEQRESLRCYVKGQLSDLPRKSIALARICGRNAASNAAYSGWV